MTLSWSNRRAFIASSLLVLVTNAIALGGVAYNRSGEPESTLEVTERELAISQRDWLDNDNGGIDLDVRWRVRLADESSTRSYNPWNREVHWLTEAQKAQLGFAAPVLTPDIEGRYPAWNPPTREAFVVLEYDGAAYRAALEQARKHLAREAELADARPNDKEFEQRLVAARNELEREELRASRLFVIDVDPDADALRARYPDRSRYAVVNARLDAHIEGGPQVFRTAIYITRLDVETVSLPHAFRAIVEPLLPVDYSYSHEGPAPRFEATVHWGRRLEPWIVQLKRLEPGNADDPEALDQVPVVGR